jgi:hypothetical protein
VSADHSRTAWIAELTRGDGAHGHEKHGKEASPDNGCPSCDGVSDGCYEHETNDMKRSIVRLGRAQRDADREEESRKLKVSQ